MARRQYKIPFGATGDLAFVPDAVQPDGSVSLTQGFGFDYQRDQSTDPLAKVFPRNVHNGLLNEITASIGEIQQQGFPIWAIAGKPYPINAVARHNDVNWQSTIATNNDEPGVGAGATSWRVNSSASGITGASRNARMSITTASASATFTADELVVGVAGSGFLISAISKTINLATVGAGGMDIGTAPVSGYVAIYAIYNPVSGVSALLAVNATAAAAPEIYGGVNMPAGYTASALVAVLPTNGSSLFKPAFLQGRQAWPENTNALNTTTSAGSLTLLNVASSVPKNAKTLTAIVVITGTTGGARLEAALAGSGSPGNVGYTVDSRTNVSAGLAEKFVMKDIPIVTQQVIYYLAAPSAGALSGFLIDINGYTF